MFVGNLTNNSERVVEAYKEQKKTNSSNSVVLASKKIRNGQQRQQDDGVSFREPEFSWSLINSLMNKRDFDKAVSLLKSYLELNPDSAQAWGTLASIYEKQGRRQLALEAWFNFIEYEGDSSRLDPVIDNLKKYFLGAITGKNPKISSDNEWLLEKLQLLTEFRANDGELHWILASLFLEKEDDYQAQYHALMAATDPQVQKRAEKILAQLNGESLPDNLSIPLIRYGNQYLVKVNVEGEPAVLLLDTGASISGVSQSFVDRYPYLVKNTKPISLNTASGVERSYLFTVDQLGIESLSFDNHILAVLPMSPQTEFDGLLGVDILGRFDFVIDQDALLLQLKRR